MTEDNEPAYTIVAVEPAPKPVNQGRRVCGAKLRHKETTCTQTPSVGRTRCKFHGGMSPRGSASPHYRGKGYSRDLPTALADRVETLREFHELASTVDELEVVVAVIGQKIDNLQHLDGTEALELIGKGLDKLGSALRDEPPDYEKCDEAYRELGDVLGLLTEMKRDWKEIFDAIEIKRRLVETQLKREQLDSTTMTASQAMTFVAEVKTAALEEIKDPVDRERFMLRVQSRLGGSTKHKQLPSGD